MLIVRHGGAATDKVRGAVVALGNFDGLHLGHQGVIAAARAIAAKADTPWGVLTFEPHPRQFFQPSTVPFRITPFRSKAHLLRKLGADVMVVLRFGPNLAGMLAQDFVQRIVLERLRIRHIVTGPGFVFGKGRKGNATILSRMAEMEGFGYTQIDTVIAGAEACSATDIRVLLRRGQVMAAATLLGRAWEFEGRVVHGTKLGRTLGFPTANLGVAGRLHPSPGIYAVRAGLREGSTTVWRDAVASLGTRPTFKGEETLLEVFIFDYAGDLYGRRLRVAFVDRLRRELRFDDVAALTAQMARDCDDARAVLESRPLTQPSR
ncbi:MAG: bifunctional riboflavin kinase/FAD synthetase [Alphaproteobacteria bacterium]|nr:bifunctional riboflavin kinase/FAD synthetase [Alphaproteobacteria bacterium]